VEAWQPGIVQDHQGKDDPVRIAYGRLAESETAYSGGRAGYQQLYQQLGRKGKLSSLAFALSLATHSGLNKTNVKQFLKPAAIGFFQPADVSVYHTTTTCEATYTVL